MTTPETAVTPAAPEAASAPAAPAAPSADWTAGFNDDMKGYVQNKGFKDPSAVLESYRNFEKLMGVPQDRMIKLPEKADDKAAWDSIYNRLGRPEKPEEYGIKGPEGDASVEWARKTFHELGLTRTQAETLFQKYAGFSSEAAKAQETAAALAAQNQEAALKKEWGAEFDQRTKIAKAAAAKFGLTGEVIDAMEKSAGFAGIMKFLHEVGASVSEDSFVGSSNKGATGATSRQAALQKIKDLYSDVDFGRRLEAGDTNAKNEWDRLNQIAYSSDM